MRELYFSIDVETDGPIPGEYSMISYGVCVVGYRDSNGPLITVEPKGIERRLAPISEQYDPEALAVSGLERDWLVENGISPSIAMRNIKLWVEANAQAYEARPVFIAYPLSFDWSFSHYYFERFAAKDPFGFSNAIDIKTLYMALTLSQNGFQGQLLLQSHKKFMPKDLFLDKSGKKPPHTHNALDDAIGQGVLFTNIMSQFMATFSEEEIANHANA
jgi:hypothetical protein